MEKATSAKVQEGEREENSLSRQVLVYPCSDICALQGALTITHYIDGMIPVVHASKGCNFVFVNPVVSCSGNQGASRYGGYITPSTNLLEKDVIMGGEEKIYTTLEAIPDIYDGVEAAFVMTGCTGDIIGDDLERAIRRAKPKLDAAGIETTLFADVGGFKGRSSYGSNLVLNKICKEVVEAPKKKLKNTVNVLGGWPHFKPFWRGEMAEVKRILELLGISINVILPGECDLEGIKRMAEVALNVVISDHIGVEAAAILEEKYGTPYVTLNKGTPIGAEASGEVFTEIAKRLSLDMDEVKKKLDEEERTFYRQLEGIAELWSIFTSQSYALIGDCDYVLGILRFMTGTLGFCPSLIAFTSYGEGTKEAVDEMLKELVPWKDVLPEGEVSVLYDPNLPELQEKLDEVQPNIILGRSVDKAYAMKNRLASMVAFYPIVERVIIDRNYFGYRGGLTFAEDFLTAAAGGGLWG